MANKKKQRDVSSGEALKMEALTAHFKEYFDGESWDEQKLGILLNEWREGPGLRELYGLSWPGKQRAREEALTSPVGVLEECEEESLFGEQSVDRVIEGDNLEVLKLLREEVGGKVKVIYIDPPYNTGQDFIYRDNFRESLQHYRSHSGEEDGCVPSSISLEGRHHAGWLSFMFPRLLLARDLLREDGVIFCSIDDFECHNLRHLLDEVFGVDCFVGMLTWERKRKGSHLSKQLTKKTEYVLVYAKNSKGVRLFGESAGEEETQPLVKKISPERRLHFPSHVLKTRMSDRVFAPGLYGEGNSAVELSSEVRIKDGCFVDDVELKGRFIWTQQRVDLEIERGGSFTIHTERLQPRVLKSAESRGFKALSTLLLKDIGTNEDATEEVSKRLGLPVDSKLIGYPKPIGLIEKLIESVTHWDREGLVLDFFAGTGTTGEVVWRLNQRDGGNRRFILVQLAEETGDVRYPNITSMTRARLRVASALLGGVGEEARFGFRSWRVRGAEVREE